MNRSTALTALTIGLLFTSACDSGTQPTSPLPPVARSMGHINTTITHLVAVDTMPANYSGGAQTEEFTIHNNTNDSGTAIISCSGANSITCWRQQDGNMIHMAAHQTFVGGWALAVHTGAANANGRLYYSTDSGSQDSTKILVQ